MSLHRNMDRHIFLTLYHIYTLGKEKKKWSDYAHGKEHSSTRKTRSAWGKLQRIASLLNSSFRLTLARHLSACNILKISLLKRYRKWNWLIGKGIRMPLMYLMPAAPSKCVEPTELHSKFPLHLTTLFVALNLIIAQYVIRKIDRHQ